MRHHEHSPHSRGGRHRARRGAIVTAALLLLDERPMHGYELITELEARSDGRWRPSPGTMYPALNRMEERGLVDVEEIDGKRQFSLTEAGRTRVAEYRDAKSDDEPAPWDDNGHGERGDLRGAMAELVGQARQIGRFGTPEQVEQAKSVLADTKRKLYAILAAEPAEPAEQGDAE
jgi:DNA-binding PadR family transcriptional regulator